MKIRPVTDTFQPFHRISEKQDKDGFSQQHQGQSQSGNKERDSQDPEITTTFDEVNTAIETFASDKQTQDNGLTATMAGSGPGLRVFLKDGSGAVIRQMTGDEFVKLRETVSKDSKSRGKILDQKL